MPELPEPEERILLYVRKHRIFLPGLPLTIPLDEMESDYNNACSSVEHSSGYKCYYYKYAAVFLSSTSAANGLYTRLVEPVLTRQFLQCSKSNCKGQSLSSSDNYKKLPSKYDDNVSSYMCEQDD